MSGFASSIPVNTPITDSSRPTMTWERWFRDLGNDWVSSNNVIRIPDVPPPGIPTYYMNYVVSQGLTHFSFSGIELSPVTITLPFQVLEDSVYQQSVNGVLTLEVLAKDAKSLVIPAGTVKLSGFYFNKFNVLKPRL